MMFNEESEDMDTTDTPWQWHYLADCGRWHRLEDDLYNPLRSEDIEKYYQINSKGVLSTFSSNYNTTIDFSAMLQTDLSTGRQRRIQRGYNIGRSCSCVSVSPVFWERADPTCPYQLIPLGELTAEYQCVDSYVKNEGLLDRPIISICRIQNSDLWDIFCIKKKQLMRIKGVKEIQERRLFHGTQIKNVDSICKNNFDLRLAGQHAHVYGKGIYFARHASFADRYSTSSSHPLNLYDGETQRVSSEPRKIIFLARVMIGKSVVGQPHFKKPDHGSAEDIHHSCVDDVKHPSIFVIFDPNQIYPEYLIQYK